MKGRNLCDEVNGYLHLFPCEATPWVQVVLDVLRSFGLLPRLGQKLKKEVKKENIMRVILNSRGYGCYNDWYVHFLSLSTPQQPVSLLHVSLRVATRHLCV